MRDIMTAILHWKFDRTLNPSKRPGRATAGGKGVADSSEHLFRKAVDWCVAKLNDVARHIRVPARQKKQMLLRKWTEDPFLTSC